LTNAIEHTKAVPLFEQQPRETTKAFAAFEVYLEFGAASVAGCSKRHMEFSSQKSRKKAAHLR
jgi:hypothetical protein